MKKITLILPIIYLFTNFNSFCHATQPNNKLAHDIFKQLIEIQSVHDTGTKDAATALAARFKAAGFSSNDIILIPVDHHPNQVNLLVYLHGANKNNIKPVLWLTHLDVVQAKPSDWSLPPFIFTEKDGYYYGRGATDMKDEVSAVAASLIRLKQENFIPNRDIIAAFTSDEELGEDQDGASFLFSKHRELVDAGLVINPDGGSGEMIGNKRLDFIIETCQKTYATYLFEVKNNGGHSSEPRSDNAIYSLANGLTKLSNYSFPFVINPTIKIYFNRLAMQHSGETRADMLAVAQDNPDMNAAARLAKTAPYNALLHTTCVATMLSAGHQENALAQSATATVQCRLMPGESPDMTIATLQKIVNDPTIHIKLLSKVVIGRESKPTPAILASVEKVAHLFWPNVAILPAMNAGASDSVYPRNLGIPSYGIGGSWRNLADLRWHGKDERHEISDFYTDVEFTYQLMKELAA